MEDEVEEVLREAMAKEIRSKKNELFACPEKIDQILDQYQLDAPATAALMMAVNCVLESMAKGIEDGTIGQDL